MASITRYKTKAGTLWRVQYRDNSGKARTKRGFGTKGAAQAWAAANTVALSDGTWAPEAARRQTVGALGDVWLKSQTHLKPSTYRTTESVWRIHVKPHWGGWQIGRIRHSDVQAWVSGMKVGASMSRKAAACLAQVLDVAVRDGAIATNPARGVRLPRKPAPSKVYLTMEQVGWLADECARPELVWLLATTGVRWGEAAALRPMDVDATKRRIHIRTNAVTVGSEVVIGTPKTHEARTVAVPTFVMGMVRPLLKGKGKTDLVWTAQRGGPMPNPSHGDWFYGALERTMAKHKNFPRVTPHGLRHVAAGLMITAGASPLVVQRQLGHASAAMTLDTYADLWDGELDEVADALDVVKMKSDAAN